MGAFGLESDSVLGPGAGQRRAVAAARLPRAEWPDRPMIVVADNAGLASGYANVVVLSPLGGRSQAAGPLSG